MQAPVFTRVTSSPAQYGFLATVRLRFLIMEYSQRNTPAEEILLS